MAYRDPNRITPDDDEPLGVWLPEDDDEPFVCVSCGAPANELYDDRADRVPLATATRAQRGQNAQGIRGRLRHLGNADSRRQREKKPYRREKWRPEGEEAA